MSFWTTGAPRLRIQARDRRLPPSWGDHTWLDQNRYEPCRDFFKLVNETTGPSVTTNLNLATYLDMPCSIVYSAHTNFSHLFRGLEAAFASLVIPSAGKGWDLPKGTMSSFGEAVERVLAMYSTFSLRDEGKIIFTSYAELDRKGEKAVHPKWFRFFHPRQYEDPLIPWQPMDEQTKLGWIQGRYMVSGDKVWIPAQIACFAYPPYKGETIFGFTASVGMAAGFNATEATCHGMYEFIERDALNVRWATSFYPRQITDVPWAELCPELKDHPLLDNPAFEFTAYDWTLDTPGINVVAAQLINRRLDAVSYYSGMTASADPVDALRSSTSELSQGIRFLPLYSRLKKEGKVPKYFRIERTSSVEEVDNLFKTMLYYGYTEHRDRLYNEWLSKCPPVAWDDFKQEWQGRTMPRNYEEHYAAIKESMRAKGWDPILTDLTPSDWTHLKVMKAHVPEITPYTIIYPMAGHPRYDQVRQAMKIQDRPFEYEQFNHAAIPFP